MDEAARYLRAATKIVSRLADLQDLDGFLQSVCDLLADELGAALARIWVREPGGRELVLRASAGLSRRVVGSSRERIDIASYPYKVGQVARSGQPFICNALEGDPQFEQAFVRAERLQSVAALPLADGELLGVLVFFSRAPLQPDKVSALEALAGTVSAAVRLSADREARAWAESGLRMLAEAGRLLSGVGLDRDATLRALVQVSVPKLADTCAVHVAEDGRLQLRAFWCEDPAMREKIAAFTERYPMRLDDDTGPPAVLRTGRSRLYPHIDRPTIPRYDRDPEHVRDALEIASHACMLVPLTAHGRTLGVMSFTRNRKGGRYDEQDLALAEELASRAAIALDNVELYADAVGSLRAREEFLSIASHELKTPLTALLSQVQLLQTMFERGAPSVRPDRVAGMLDRVERQGARLGTLVDNLLDLSRIEAGRLELHLEEVDLAELVRDMATRSTDELARSGSRLAVAPLPGGAVGRWDRMRIEQVVTNLLSNAIKYGRGRPIEITLETRPGWAALAVRDQGIGIEPEEQERVFDRFRRAGSARRYGGLGLGLYIVKQILDQHRGLVRVESRPGEGSTFTVELPLAEPPSG